MQLVTKNFPFRCVGIVYFNTIYLQLIGDLMILPLFKGGKSTQRCVEKLIEEIFFRAHGMVVSCMKVSRNRLSPALVVSPRLAELSVEVRGSGVQSN